MPRQYSTVCGHLTPTQPRHEDMRMDSTLDVTPEGSLSDLPAAVGGAEDSGREQRTQEAPENEVCVSFYYYSNLDRGNPQYLCKNSTWKRFE